MTDSFPGLSLSGRQLNIQTENPAKEDKDVFFPLDETVTKLKQLLAQATDEGSNIIFIRAPVAAGKTTLANYLRTKHSDEFVIVASATSERQWFKHVIEASGQTNLDVDNVRNALISIAKQGKTIIIDEAHRIFEHPKVVVTFFKDMEIADVAPTFLLFSASGSTQDSQGNHVSTPKEIKRKYMWYPPIPNTSIDKLRTDLAEAKKPVYLDAESVQFFVTLCGGHRGIFMHAMKWVQEKQQNAPQSSVDISENTTLNITNWKITQTVSNVRKTLEESNMKTGALGWNVGLRKFLKECRAVRVNGDYSNILNIPKEFGLVLYGGPKLMEELNNQERTLAISGFLFPERRDTDRDNEFVKYDWNDSTVIYAVPNPVMAEYYGDILPHKVKHYKRQLLEEKKKPDCAADLMARVLPYLTFTAVVDNPISREDGSLSNCLSRKGMPYEDDYNDGSTCAIESIMAAQDLKAHLEHAKRFSNPKKMNYNISQQQLLLVIGGVRKQVKERVQYVAKTLGKKGILEIVGLCVSLNHDSYEMFREGEEDPIYFVCDRVPKTLKKDNDGRFETAQICVFECDDTAPHPKKSKPSEEPSY
ncbi:expressed unknown protein [Seminavis robusta]|uniref:ORC1/DEAH AAA+ ATPase domain-containing protein n=1 Tax=Seminavis robusta TaxID=568900 RepID=A0A9N8DE18_9STRA|nr:expressed unknown protein [Seminavis robusta]|eukprot:Sro45_g027210.1 n/a (589) ;mRNA; f:146795-148757